MLMPRTNLYYGWEYLRGGYNDATPVDSDREHDMCRWWVLTMYSGWPAIRLLSRGANISR